MFIHLSVGSFYAFVKDPLKFIDTKTKIAVDMMDKKNTFILILGPHQLFNQIETFVKQNKLKIVYSGPRAVNTTPGHDKRCRNQIVIVEYDDIPPKG